MAARRGRISVTHYSVVHADAPPPLLRGIDWWRRVLDDECPD